MRKWVVLALGAVLAVGGLISIWQGSDIIQIERGWTQVIAGTVALAGGVVTLALYALIAKVEEIAAKFQHSGAGVPPQSAGREVVAEAPAAARLVPPEDHVTATEIAPAIGSEPAPVAMPQAGDFAPEPSPAFPSPHD